jgi:chromosome partitioning protein
MDMAKIIAVANRKGGVGKTTTAICLAHFIGQHEKKVLLIDLDPQNALAAALSPEGEAPTGGAVNILRRNGDPKGAVGRTRLPNVDLIPCGNAEAPSHEEEALFAIPQKRAGFARALSELAKPYAYVLIDSPPGSSAIVQFALAHAESVIIPLQCQPLALRIMPQILNDIKQLIETANPLLEIEGVLLTMYDFWDPFSPAIADQVWSCFPEETTFRAVIRRSPVYERIFDSERNPLLEENPPEELLDYNIIAQLILAKEQETSRSFSEGEARHRKKQR